MTAATMSAIVDRFGKPVHLAESVGRGGEGEIFVLRQHPQRVAKLYFSPPGPDLAAKLETMAAGQHPNLLRCTAWPLELLYDAREPDRVCGFVMPRVRDTKPLHILYGPKTRKEQFPKANYSFLLHTAANVARMFAAVHDAGHVIGDVNHANLLVGAQGTVWAIDCDSFQISGQERIYGCDVGVMTHQPPELQQLTTLRGIRRTANHDRFGLAVLIFQLLMMGRHPFAGRTNQANELTLEQAIQAYRYVYSAQSAEKGITAPPGSVPVDRLPVGVQRLFDRAFSPNGAVTDARPAAEEWIQALETARRSIRTCSENSMHQYFSHSKTCIWCELAERRKVDFFPESETSDRSGNASSGTDETAAGSKPSGPVAGEPQTQPLQSAAQTPSLAERIGRPDEHRLWFAIQAIPAPKDKWPLPGLANCRNGGTERPAVWRKQMHLIRAAALVCAAALGVAAMTAFPVPSVFNAAGVGLDGWLSGWYGWSAAALSGIAGVFAGHSGGKWYINRQIRIGKREAQSAWKQLRREAARQAREQKAAYDQVIESFAEIRTAIIELPSYRLKRMQEWLTQLPERQKKQYLAEFRIADAKMNGIGDGRKMVLQSYGIETAADINEEQLKHVPGIGQQISQLLYEWQESCARGFQPDPRAGLTRQDHVLLDREVAVRKDGLLRKLETGIRQISELRELQDQLQQKYIEALQDAGAEWAAWVDDEAEWLR